MFDSTILSISFTILVCIYQTILPYLLQRYQSLVECYLRYRSIRSNRFRMVQRYKTRNNQKPKKLDDLRQLEEAQMGHEVEDLVIVVVPRNIQPKSYYEPPPNPPAYVQTQTQAAPSVVRKRPNTARQGHLIDGPPPGFPYPQVPHELHIYTPRPRTVRYNQLEKKIQQWEHVLKNNPTVFNQRFKMEVLGSRIKEDPDWVDIKLDLDVYIRDEQLDLELRGGRIGDGDWEVRGVMRARGNGTGRGVASRRRIATRIGSRSQPSLTT